MSATASERTELEWIYQPSDFFEGPYRYAGNGYEVIIDSGRAVATLDAPQNPLCSDLEENLQSFIRITFQARQLRVSREYSLHGPRVYQHINDRKTVQISVAVADALVLTGGLVDITIKDQAGNIVQDTKAERIAAHNAELNSVVAKAAHLPLLHSLLESYERSVRDPANSLVYLYEVRDALKQHYKNKRAAMRALGISEGDWERLGSLSCNMPLEEGRHRGGHPFGRRKATAEELEEARQIVRTWILTFAALQVPSPAAGQLGGSSPD